MTEAETGGRKFIVLDASVWVSRLVPQDEFHAAVRDWMEEPLAAGVQFVFHDLFQPQRQANLRARLDEYTPAGMNAGILFVN